MEELIKDFECHLTLMADDLHDIVSHSNSIVQYIKEHESEWSRSGTGNNVQITPIGNEGRRIARYKIDDNPERYIYAPTTTSGLNGDTTIIIPRLGTGTPIADYVASNGSGTIYAPAGGGSGGGNGGQDGLSTLFAFRGFANDSTAENDWSLIKNSLNYPPSGWSTSSNVTIQEGHMLYMTTAQRQGNNYITTNGVVWQKPVRIGSGSDTSHTGTDEDNYNYIYCRTTTNVAPELTGIVGLSSYGVSLLESIEGDSDKNHGYKPGSNNYINIPEATVENINEAWTDHPYGVSPQLPFEWQVGFKKNEESGNWEYYFGPVIISHYGYDGLDGDGLEYIFYLQPKNLAGIPSLGAPYDGSVTKNGTTINYTNVLINSTNYQLDDFIPTGWHDNPQTVSEEYPRQYVSIRKKEGSQEANNLWKAFSTPRLWNIYATNGFLATLDNDSIILDDDNGSEAIEFVSLTKVFLWDGANDVTLSNNYAKITVEINCVGFTSLLKPGLVTSTTNNNVVISSDLDKSGWGTAIQINKSNYLGFALTKVVNGNPKLSTGAGSITYTIRAYKNVNDATPEVEASRVQTIQVVDINNGMAYLLLVTPNTLGVSRTNETSPYTLRDAQSIAVTATAATETSIEGIEIKNGSTNANNGELYVVVSNSGGTSLGITPTISNNNKTLTYDLSNLLNLVTTIAYVTVNLYYMYNGTGIKVDSETVDFSIKGDKGQDGSPGDSGNPGQDSVVYNLEPYPTSLKFNVAPDGTTLTPSELVARCKISKKVGNNDYIFSNNNIDGYCLYYNITNASGLLVNLSGVPTGNYVIYNNDDAAIAGIHISNLDLNYILVNFYLSKAKTTDLLTQQGDLYYTNDISPIIKQVSVPILRDGLKGDSSSTGQTGRFYYFAGDWDGDVTSTGLKVTNYSYPYVYYLGSYYMYVGDPSSTSPYIISKADLLGTNISDITMSDNWKEMTYNKFVVSEAMFANYAKLGAAIFNRDWMISQYGSVNGVPSTNYTSFDPVKFMNAIKGYAEIGVVLGGGLAPLGESGSSYNILSQLFKLPLNNYTITVTLSGSNNSGKSVRLVKFNELNLFKDISKVSIITSGNSANASTETSGTCSNGTTITLNALTSGDYVYCLLANNSSDVSVTNIKIEITGSYTAFIPNFALDLRSGLTYLNNAYIKGLVSTVNDLVVLKEESQNLSNWATVSDRGLFCRNDVDTPSPSLNEVLASIGVHKYTDNYGYTILSGEINLRRRLNGSSNWNYANLNGSGLTFAYHEGSSISDLTKISALNIKTNLVIAPVIDGGYTFDGPKVPVSFPGNINLDAIVTLPKSGLVPYSGTIIFATNCKTVKVEDNSIVYNSEGQGETYSDTETALINSSALGGTHTFLFISPRIFVGYYKDNILRWREFCCRQ